MLDNQKSISSHSAMNSRAQSQVQSSSISLYTPATMNIVQRNCTCGGSAGLSGECFGCQKKKLVGEHAPLVQPKLKISQPDDKYEQEADRVADEVLRMPESRVQDQSGFKHKESKELIQTKPIARKITPLVQKEIADEEEEQVQLKAVSNSETNQLEESKEKQKKEKKEEGIVQLKEGNNSETQHFNSSLVQDAVQSPGHKIDPTTRSFMEQRFGHDFSQVKIHTDNKATASSRAIDARAYTFGENIVFGAEQYLPSTQMGRHLLAHELTHTLQQKVINKSFNEPGNSIVRRMPQIRKESKIERNRNRLVRFLGRVIRRGDGLITKRSRVANRRGRKARQILNLINSKDREFMEDIQAAGYKIDINVKKTLLIIARQEKESLLNRPDEDMNVEAGKLKDKAEDLEEINGQQEGATLVGTESENEANNQKTAELHVEKCPTSGYEGPFKSTDLAAKAFKKRWNPVSIKNNQEVCSIIIHCISEINSARLFYYRSPWGFSDKKKAKHSCPAFLPFNGRKPGNYAGGLHTHGGDDSEFINDKFSPDDRAVCRRSGFPCYVATPSECLLKNTGKGIKVLEDPLKKCDPNPKKHKDATR